MGIRDEELKRLVKYAEGMGAKVVFKPSDPTHNARAEWSIKGDLITIYSKPTDSKLSLILSLIHEIGHHVSFIEDDNRIHPKGLLEALNQESAGLPLSKHQRRLILKSELMGMRWWDSIYNSTNMKFPRYKLYLEREYDTWYYNFLFQVGRDPTRKEKNVKLKQLKGIFNAQTER